jgi:sec-independent protein translocase protein TatA
MFLATPTLHPTLAAFYGLGGPELLIIAFVLLLLFGGRKLPEMARGTGRALRIFKAETKGLMDDDDDTPTSTPQRTSLPSATSPAADTVTPAPPPSTAASGTTGATAAPEIGTSSPVSDGLPPTHTET